MVDNFQIVEATSCSFVTFRNRNLSCILTTIFINQNKLPMKRFYIISVTIFCLCNTAIFGQFYNSFVNSTLLERETSAIQLNDGLVFGFTESDSHNNFHQNILLIKTNASGNIIWSKRYDAGAAGSLHLIEMLRTFSNEILISGETGVSRFVLKISAAGNLVWAKKYASGAVFSFRGLVQLKDSSFVFSNEFQQSNPGFVQIDGNGNVIIAAQIKNRQFQSVQSITAKGNTIDIVVANSNVANINLKTRFLVWQRQYNTSNQFSAFVSARCKNGDIIYLAGRSAGGVLSGTSRVFRTNANGNLLWAKNLRITYDTSGLQFSIFDIVNQNFIHEDKNGNIVAFMEDESLQDVMVVFSASGNYLYHRFFNTPTNFITEESNGNYLHASPISNTTKDPVISNRNLTTLSVCDSTIFVTTSNGTDSAAALNALNFAIARSTPVDIPVSVTNAAIQKNIFCSLQAILKNSNEELIHVTIIPNPAFDKIRVATSSDIAYDIYDIYGNLKMRAVTNQVTDISKLKAGLYSIVITTKDGVIRKTFIKK